MIVSKLKQLLIQKPPGAKIYFRDGKRLIEVADADVVFTDGIKVSRKKKDTLDQAVILRGKHERS